jgi:DNA-binding transcriptional MerR regulator
VDAADGSVGSNAYRASDNRSAAREYRIGELAREAGITVRTLRYYQERKLLPPPRRAGRISWYSQTHVNRLRVIGQLLERGHTLGGIGELLSAWEQGYDLADLLGFERAMTAPWSDETPVPVGADDLSALFNGQLTPEVLEEAVRLGYIDIAGDRVIHVSRRLLDIATVLAREGIPLPAILAAGRELQSGLDKMASLFVEIVVTHVLDHGSGAPPPHEVARLAEAIERLRPIARTVLDAEFGRAMDRRARVTYDEFIRLLAARDRLAGSDTSGSSDAPAEPNASRAAILSSSSDAEATTESHATPERLSSEPGRRA